MNEDSLVAAFAKDFRLLLMPLGFGLLLPLPMLATAAHSEAADIATLYLGLGAAWIAAEAFRPGREPRSLLEWRRRMLTLVICLVTNAAVFWAFGVAAGVRSNIPLPLLAVFGISPALGLVPWLTTRLQHPYAAILLGGATVGAIKLAACVVARIVYGPEYIERGYVSADWQTAKLMISLLWAGTLVVSLLALMASRRWAAIQRV